MQTGHGFQAGDRADTWAAPEVPQVAVIVVLCGTRIVTEQGEMRVEEIRPGDVLVGGSAQPVTVIEARTGSLTRSALIGLPRLTPVSIGAGSLGRGLPQRDLLVHPLTPIADTGKASPCLATTLVGGHRIARVFPDGLHYVALVLPPGARVQAEGVWLSPTLAAHPGISLDASWQHVAEAASPLTGRRRSDRQAVPL